MKARFKLQLVLTAALALLAAGPAGAAMFMLGDQDFTDGQILTGTPQFDAASAGEPAPFDMFIGSDVGADFSASFTFNFAADTYTAASLTFGIFDHDSAAAGDQVALFSLDGVDLTTELNALLNASGGANLEDNVYTIGLTGSALTAVQDGAATFMLTLQGPLPSPFAGLPDLQFNGAGLDFATLDVQAQPAVPEPSTWVLLTLGLAGIAWRRRR